MDQGVEDYKFYGLRYRGGLIYYINNSSKIGYVAHIDVENRFRWGCYPSSVGTSNYLGDGPDNTQAILDDCSLQNTAAKYCDTLTVNGYEDWFLPSKNGLYTIMDAIGSHAPNETFDWNGTGAYHQYAYWSSSEDYSTQAWIVYQPGGAGYEAKNDYYEVIAARKFLAVEPGPYVPVQERLDNGETPIQIYLDGIPYDSLMGKIYEGGYIIYLNTIGGDGMVAAESSYEVTGFWGCYGTSVFGTGYNVGYGLANTSNFIVHCGDFQSAIYRCASSSINGYNDWYCPGVDELDLIYEKIHDTGVHLYTVGEFWSSTQLNSTSGFGVNFNTGQSFTRNKTTVLSSIPVRSFD